jgi:hypothetical protein
MKEKEQYAIFRYWENGAIVSARSRLLGFRRTTVSAQRGGFDLLKNAVRVPVPGTRARVHLTLIAILYLYRRIRTNVGYYHSTTVVLLYDSTTVLYDRTV